jgi:hypothetical protein
LLQRGFLVLTKGEARVPTTKLLRAVLPSRVCSSVGRAYA